VLGFTGVIVLLMVPVIATPAFIWIAIFSVVSMGLLRLKLPKRPINKILYTGLEGIILLLPSLLNTRLPFIPPLGIVIVIRSCQMFELPGRLVVSGSTFAAFVLTILVRRGGGPGFIIRDADRAHLIDPQFSHLATLTLKLNAVFSFGLALVCMLLLINALLEERQSRAQLAIAHEQLRQYALRIEDQSALQERNHIAREIHDSLGHTLTAQSIQLDSALLLLQSNLDQASQFLQEAKQLCKQALKEVRQSVTTLRTDPLQGKALEISVKELIKEFQVTTAIAPNCTIRVPHPIALEVTSAVYRILQEALTNITRHSVATDVTLQLLTRDQTLHLLVKDNGKGFNPAQNSTGFGLQGMRERTAALGGQFHLVSQPGAGCLITVKIPITKVLLA
jgi:signal transduction histidine kinase